MNDPSSTDRPRDTPPGVTWEVTRLDRLGSLPAWVVWLVGLSGVVVCAGVISLLSVTPALLPNPGTVLLIGVVWAGFVAGTRAALCAAVLTELIVLAGPRVLGSRWIGAAGDERAALLVSYGAAALLTAVLVGALRQRGEQRVARERAMRERQAELERVKSNFLNVASHELRSPIAVARGYVAMLGDGTFGPVEASDIRRAVPVLEAKLDEMNSLVDSMLDAARLEERRLVLRLETLDLRTVVDAAVRAALPSLTPGHRLEWRRPRREVLVDGDLARLGIVVTNLVVNGVRYSPAGGPVSVFLAEDGDMAALTVWDHGLGIAEVDLQRLFTRFGRIVTPENSHINGTGLGLYLARELARLHGGDIVVASAEGRGSSFTLVLPRHVSATVERASGVPDAEAPGRPGARDDVADRGGLGELSAT